MKRRIWFLALIVAVVAMAGAILLVFTSVSRAGGPPSSAEQVPVPSAAAISFPGMTRTVFALPSDTPPPLERMAGWPFSPLPRIAKFTQPVPDVALATSFTTFTQPLPIRTLPPFALTPPDGGTPAAAWLLPPLAAVGGLALGSRAGAGEEPPPPPPPPPPPLVPEPSTLVLLATGFLLLTLLGVRRGRMDRES